MTRRTIARAYPVPPLRVVTYRQARGLWWIVDRRGRRIGPPYASPGGAIAAAHHLARPPPRQQTPTDAPQRPRDRPPAVDLARLANARHGPP